MHYFLGLTFIESDQSFKEINKFRQKFDNKYEQNPTLQMSLLPPFSFIGLSKNEFKKSLSHLSDVFDDYFIGHEQTLNIKFDQVDFNCAKTNTFFLKPKLPLELDYCLDGLEEVIEHFGGTFSKKRNKLKPSMLPVARIKDGELEDILGDTKELLSRPLELRVNTIELFQRNLNSWRRQHSLFSFAFDEESHFNEDKQKPFYEADSHPKYYS